MKKHKYVKKQSFFMFHFRVVRKVTIDGNLCETSNLIYV